MVDIAAVLEERGKQYGKFEGHAKISQSLKIIAQSYPGWELLADDQRECIEMIFHKIARALNGNPKYADNFTDIAGYAKLVADRLLAES
jgi:hypothetical protein